MEDFSLEEAYKIVRLHLSEPGGLMHQIENGSEIDGDQVQVLSQGMERIEQGWRNVSVIPKSIVKILYDVCPRLERCMRIYPEREDELHNLYYQFCQWIDKIFAENPLSEEAAIMIVHQQIAGLRPIALELRERCEMNEVDVSLDVFYMALDRLAEIWKSKEYISKLAAGSLVNAQDLFISLADLYSGTEQQAFQQAKQEVFTRVSQCLR
jgi:hypothetical protein